MVKSDSFIQLNNNILSGGHISLNKENFIRLCRHEEQCSNACEGQFIYQSRQIRGQPNYVEQVKLIKIVQLLHETTVLLLKIIQRLMRIEG